MVVVEDVLVDDLAYCCAAQQGADHVDGALDSGPGSGAGIAPARVPTALLVLRPWLLVVVRL